MIRRQRSKNTVANATTSTTPLKRQSLSVQGTQTPEELRLLEHSDWGDGMNGCGHFGGSAAARTRQPHLPSRLPACVIASFQATPMWLLHANSPSVKWQARCASEGKSVLRRGELMSWHGRLSRKPKRAHVGQTRLPLLACCPRHRSGRGHCAVPGWRLVGVAFGRCAGRGRD